MFFWEGNICICSIYTYIYTHIYILYHICNHSLFYFGFASFQHSETALSKKGPFFSQRCTTRPCEDKPNIILCENRTPGPLGNQQMHTGDSMQIGMPIGGLSRQMVGSCRIQRNKNTSAKTDDKLYKLGVLVPYCQTNP